MKKTQIALLVTAVASLILVGAAVYLQVTKDMLPCPLCVIQRYAFILLAIGSVIAMSNTALTRKLGCSMGLYASISGAGVALYQLYVIAHPNPSCGRDPIQVAINNLPMANWLPALFYSEGFCATNYDPILGLSLPQWSLVWFIVFTVVLLVALFKGKST